MEMTSPAFGSDCTTQGIRVQVVPEFLPEESDPRHGRWVFAYHVRITNLGTEPVRLVSRRWVITDGAGRVEEVEGPGVVGRQPLIGPGMTHQYSSGCPLPTPAGTMEGSYQMVSARGARFDARIAPFRLVEPTSVN